MIRVSRGITRVAGLALAALLATGLGVRRQVVAAQEPSRVGPEATVDLLVSVEAAVTAGSASQFLALSTLDPDSADVQAFLERWFNTATTRAVVKERDRQPSSLDQGAVTLVVEVLVEAGSTGRLATWRLEVGPTADGVRVLSVGTLGEVGGLSRLELDGTRQFRAHNLTVSSEDLELRLPSGDVFVAEAAGGVTAAVLIGRGEMVFRPGPETERRQVRLFSGHAELRTPFSAAFVRMSPGEASRRLTDSALTEEPVEPRALRQAREIFAEQQPKSFGIELGDLSRDSWSFVPTPGSFLAEVITRRFGTLTYTLSSNDQEDITLFNRAQHRNIAVYASAGRLAARGRFYDEDDATEYDVEDYKVDTTFTPDRFWLEGTTQLRIKVRAYALSAMTIKLAEALTVSSVTSGAYGRLLAPRVRGQNSLVVNLPTPASRGDVLELTFRYAGRLEPQGVDRENVTVAQEIVRNNDIVVVARPEPNYVYSNRSLWYAQGQVTDYATAMIRFTVPPAFGVACSGEPASGSPVLLRAAGGNDDAARKLHVFSASLPVRYLGCVVSRFGAAESHDAAMPAGTSVPRMAATSALPIRVVSTPRDRGRAKEAGDRAGEVAAFYGSLIHDVPYSSLTVAVVESNVPGGHSPGYLAILNEPLPTTPFVWRDDPAAFDNYPDFFIAHEVAHQWWGQAVGWKNYHEQWLSEGLAQYFAVLYAEHQRGPDVFASILRQLARWTRDASDQGPVYLGYRLAYLKGGGRTFRALVYNKGAIVLHMLRRMLGDEAFFRGIRRFYSAHRYSKAGTDDLERALEAESGRSLGPFFERWVFGQDLPTLATSWSVSADHGSATVRLTQPAGRVFQFPVTVTLLYSDGSTEDKTVTVSDEETVATLPLKGRVRKIEVNRDQITPLAKR
jgi:Peptidase family M1 domain